ncbi:MAG: outer membrane beta-barrel protein [bacterium]
MSEEKLHREPERLDELFRKSLGETRTEPSAGAWKKIDRRLLRSELLRLNLSNLPRSLWIAIPAAVLITGTILFFGTGEKEGSTQQPVQKESIADQPVQEIKPPPTENPAAEFHAIATPGEGNSSEPEVVNQPAYPTSSNLQEAPLSLPEAMESLGTLDIRIPEPFFTNLVTPPDISPVSNPVPQPKAVEPSGKQLPRSLDMGINISPDLVFYQSPSSSFKYNYTLDLGAQYNLGRFYVESGAGLTYSTDIGNYAISYLKNDSVGFYYSIVSFTPDPGNPSHTVFETKQVTVYDSVEYMTDQSTKNRYLYLQIPLSFGYRFLDKPMWRLSVEAGLFYNYLISIREPAPTFYMSEARILDIQKRTPERNRNSYGVLGGIKVEYQFARNFYLLIEPTFKYAIQAIEESSRSGAKQPYSVGLRAGIWYTIDFKNKTK